MSVEANPPLLRWHAPRLGWKGRRQSVGMVTTRQPQSTRAGCRSSVVAVWKSPQSLFLLTQSSDSLAGWRRMRFSSPRLREEGVQPHITHVSRQPREHTRTCPLAHRCRSWPPSSEERTTSAFPAKEAICRAVHSLSPLARISAPALSNVWTIGALPCHEAA